MSSQLDVSNECANALRTDLHQLRGEVAELRETLITRLEVAAEARRTDRDKILAAVQEVPRCTCPPPAKADPPFAKPASAVPVRRPAAKPRAARPRKTGQ